MKLLPFLNATLRRLTLFCLLATASFSTLTAQDTTATRMQEIGLQISNFNLANFGVIYKKQRLNTQNRYTRIRFIFTNLSYSNQSNSDTDLFNGSFGGAIGTERRVNLNERIQFLHGPEFSTIFNYTNNRSDQNNARAVNSSTGISAGFGYILGLQYNFRSPFYISLESIPSITANYNSFSSKQNLTENKGSTWGAAVGFNSNVAALTFAYRFGVARK